MSKLKSKMDTDKQTNIMNKNQVVGLMKLT
jgi:hypothetical protein